MVSLNEEDEGYAHSVPSGKRSCWSSQTGLDNRKVSEWLLVRRVGRSTCSGVHAKPPRGSSHQHSEISFTTNQWLQGCNRASPINLRQLKLRL